MKTVELEYVELYTKDLVGATRHFVSGFGFRECARSMALGRESVLLCQGAARLIITAGESTETFLSRHPEGIANIGIKCSSDAVPGWILTRAEHEHSEPLQRSIPGLGDVSLTLTLPRRDTRHSLPIDRDWTNILIDGRKSLGPNTVGEIDHLALCVEAGQLDIAGGSLRSLLGLQAISSERIEVGEQAMNSLVVGTDGAGLTFTILEPDIERQPGQIDNFLRRNRGPGVQHIAFLVRDIVSAVRTYEHRGVEFLPTPIFYYEQLPGRLGPLKVAVDELRETNVLFDRDDVGYLLQIFTTEPREGSTLFYELIERRGSRGFGSANIRALYEAVERDTAQIRERIRAKAG